MSLTSAAVAFCSARIGIAECAMAAFMHAQLKKWGLLDQARYTVADNADDCGISFLARIVDT
jgi:hypothetical protein